MSALNNYPGSGKGGEYQSTRAATFYLAPIPAKSSSSKFSRISSADRFESEAFSPQSYAIGSRRSSRYREEEKEEHVEVRGGDAVR